MRTIDPARLVVLDEAGANLAMGRSHAWVLRGQEYVEPRPMNWGENLTLIGAIRRTGWVTLNTKWRAVNTRFFVEWVRRRLAPRLRPHDIVLLDNLKAHKAPDVRRLVEARGATLRYLPPYSHDFSPIEPAWGLVKRHIRTHAPARAPPCVESRSARGMSSTPITVANGLSMPDTSTEVISGISCVAAAEVRHRATPVTPRRHSRGLSALPTG